MLNALDVHFNGGGGCSIVCIVEVEVGQVCFFFGGGGGEDGAAGLVCKSTGVVGGIVWGGGGAVSLLRSIRVGAVLCECA